MQETRFIENAAKVEAWINALPEEVTEVRKNQMRLNQITDNIELGLDDSADDEERTLCWTTMSKNGAYFAKNYSTLEAFPKARMGRADRYPTELRIIMTTSSQEYKSALLALPTEVQQMLINYNLPHGRTGGNYSTYENYVDHLVSVSVRNMEAAIDEGRNILDKKGVWVVKEGLPQMTPPPTKEEREAAIAKIEESNE